jgi:hypothetical protein
MPFLHPWNILWRTHSIENIFYREHSPSPTLSLFLSLSLSTLLGLLIRSLLTLYCFMDARKAMRTL